MKRSPNPPTEATPSTARQTLRALKRENQDLKWKLTETSREIEELQSALSAKDALIQSLKNFQLHSSQTHSVLETKLAHTEERIKAIEALETEQKERLEIQESQLRGYAKLLSSIKADLVDSCQRFAQELRCAKSLHPLKDYLVLTEAEITRVENQLIMLPRGASGRPALEKTVKNLYDQRTFLQSLIEASQRELDAQAGLVAQLVDRNQLEIVVPPPPPRSTRGS